EDQPRQSADCHHARATVEAECADPQVQPPDRGGGCMRRKDAVEGIGKNIDIGDAWPLPGLIDQENDGYIRKYESKEATGYGPYCRTTAQRSVQRAHKRKAVHDPRRPARMVGNEE